MSYFIDNYVSPSQQNVDRFLIKLHFSYVIKVYHLENDIIVNEIKSTILLGS